MLAVGNYKSKEIQLDSAASQNTSENTFRQENQRLVNAIESISDAFVLYDASGNLVLFNQRHLDFFPHLADLYQTGVSREKILRHHAAISLKIDPEFDVETFVKDRLQMILTPRPDKEVQLFGGRWVAVRERLVAGGGIVSIRSDITKAKQAALDLEQSNAELARSNEELQQFATIASHYLQEPLRKVQTFGDRLKSQFEEVLDEQGVDYLNRMQSAAGRMETLINDLLEFARVTSRAKSMVPVNLNEILENLKSEFEVQIYETEAKVEIGELPTIQADLPQMRQLFQNLISNALKYRREGVPVVVRISSDIVRDNDGYSEPKNRLHKIMVTDNGIGFEDEYVERIFGIFQRLHGRGSFSGTGVGLAIVRKIIERHHGTVSAKGVPNEGSTFTLVVPEQQFIDKAQDTQPPTPNNR